MIVGEGAFIVEETEGLVDEVSFKENKLGPGDGEDALPLLPISNFLIPVLKDVSGELPGESSNNLSISTGVSVLELIVTEGAFTCAGLDNPLDSPILLLFTSKSIPTVSALELEGITELVEPMLTELRAVSRSRLTSSILFVLLFIEISFILYIYATEKLKIFKTFLL